MATILLVEDYPNLGLYEAMLLEGKGHRVIRCNGAPAPLSACPMIRYGSCPLPDAADLILFSSAMFMPMRHRSYNGSVLLQRYRAHPVYGRLPMLVVTIGAPRELAGSGPIEIVEKFASPERIVQAIDRLLARRARVAPATSS
jgi:CheY-like chemotaxis protein